MGYGWLRMVRFDAFVTSFRIEFVCVCASFGSVEFDFGTTNNTTTQHRTTESIRRTSGSAVLELQRGTWRLVRPIRQRRAA